MDPHQPTPPAPIVLPLTVRYHDRSGPFAVEATVTEWRQDGRATSLGTPYRLTIGAGTLDDADKGPFPLAGIRVALRLAAGGFEPLFVVNPGVLSELQQEGLLDAICSFLNDGPGHGTREAS